METLVQVDFRETKWVLVVEKEATFTTLASSEYWRHSLAGQGILVTGKGYPDLATARFLNMVRAVKPHLPMFILVDFDPDGINIMHKYRWGSKRLRHENNEVRRLEWLGIKSNHLLPKRPRYENPHERRNSGGSDSCNPFPEPASTPVVVPRLPRRTWRASASYYHFSRPTHIEDTRLSLDPRDRKRAVKMLGELFECDGEEADRHDPERMESTRELQVMLMLNMKAEIQAVDRLGDMTDWLDDNLGKQ